MITTLALWSFWFKSPKKPTQEFYSARAWLTDYRNEKKNGEFQKDSDVEPDTVLQIDWFNRTLYRKKLRGISN